MCVMKSFSIVSVILSSSIAINASPILPQIFGLGTGILNNLLGGLQQPSFQIGLSPFQNPGFASALNNQLGTPVNLYGALFPSTSNLAAAPGQAGTVPNALPGTLPGAVPGTPGANGLPAGSQIYYAFTGRQQGLLNSISNVLGTAVGGSANILGGLANNIINFLQDTLVGGQSVTPLVLKFKTFSYLNIHKNLIQH